MRIHWFSFFLALASAEAAPHRVVPLQPSLAELAVRIGLPISEIVGVSDYTDVPGELKDKPKIGPYTKPNLEAIVALKPDLVLASRDGTPEDTVTRLRAFGIPVVIVTTESIEDLRRAYSVLGTALGKTAEATRALAEFDSDLDGLRSRAKGRSAARVLLQVGEDPLVVAAGKNFLHEGLALMGARNVYPDTRKTYPRVSVEDVLVKNPDVIVLIGMGNDISALARAEKRWRSFPNLAATRTNRIVLLRSDALVRPGPRLPRGLIDLERAVFGEEKAPR